MSDSIESSISQQPCIANAQKPSDTNCRYGHRGSIVNHSDTCPIVVITMPSMNASRLPFNRETNASMNILM